MSLLITIMYLFNRRCSLLEAPKLCKYRMKLGDDPEWYYISQLCRNRVNLICTCILTRLYNIIVLYVFIYF